MQLLFDLNQFYRGPGGDWDPTNARLLLRDACTSGFTSVTWQLGNGEGRSVLFLLPLSVFLSCFPSWQKPIHVNKNHTLLLFSVISFKYMFCFPSYSVFLYILVQSVLYVQFIFQQISFHVYTFFLFSARFVFSVHPAFVPALFCFLWHGRDAWERETIIRGDEWCGWQVLKKQQRDEGERKTRFDKEKEQTNKNNNNNNMRTDK